jgi:hypothetical protein
MARVQIRVLFYATLLLGAFVWWFTHSPAHADDPLRLALEFPRTDFSTTTVDLKDIHSGGPPKDGIPAIDAPQFVSVAAASSWLGPHEPVILVRHGGQVRVYPLQILMYHEIVNDRIDGLALAVTFCPLCNASIVFDRRVDGRVLDFGTTGRLRKSDMVMYDRQTESWWQQFTGEGIVGVFAGRRLTVYPSVIVSFGDVAESFSHAQVLSRDTGYRRSYGRNPYRGYDTIDDQPFLFFDAVDPRLPAMERVVAVAHPGGHRLYPFRVFDTEPVINDTAGAEPIVVFSKPGTASALDAETISRSRRIRSASVFRRDLDGRTLSFALIDGAIRDLETDSRWNLFGRATAGQLRGRQLEAVDHGVYFAFAWLAFDPDAEIYEAERTATAAPAH